MSWPERVVGLFLDRFGAGARPTPGRRLAQLPGSLHLTRGGGSLELFPAGPLDVLRFYQRHHDSLHHEIEYVTCRPAGAGEEDFLAYAVLRLTPEEELPLVELEAIERKLRLSYGSLAHLPRARPLFERQYGEELEDEDPPEGPNRVVPPPAEPHVPGRLSVGEVIDIVRVELEPVEVVSWLEAAFRQPPRPGRVEHRYYLAASGDVFLVRHGRDGKTLYQAETSAEALQPAPVRRPPPATGVLPPRRGLP